MELNSIKQISKNNYIHMYEASYTNKLGNEKRYELISRNPDLTLDSFTSDKRVDAVGIIALSPDREKILVSKEFRLACNKWVYNFPGGLIDEGESCIEAATRELREETGLELISVIDVLPPAATAVGLMNESVNTVICIADGEFKESTSPDEEIEPFWLDKEDVRTLFREEAYMSLRTQSLLWMWVYSNSLCYNGSKDSKGIKNIESYNNEMRKSMEDKLFFIDKINAESLVDYGCADGTLMEMLSEKDKTLKLHGIDMSNEMIRLAQERLPSASFNVNTVPFVNKKFEYGKAALNLSSVLHEVYSYSSKEQIDNFWDVLKKAGYKYIIIRDMLTDLTNEQTDIVDETYVRAKNTYEDKLITFEKIWGTISLRKNFIHFLMKYRYNNNWVREVEENYLSIPYRQVLDLLSDTYEVIYEEKFTLPFLHDKVLEDFGVDIKDTTHIKLILKIKDL